MIKELRQYLSDPNLTLHIEAIKFYVSRLSENSIFRSAVIVGSFAKGYPDRLSDIDLVLFVEEKDRTNAFNYITKAEPFTVVHSFEGVHDEKNSYKKYIFDNYVSAEIHVMAKSYSFKLRKPYITLLDHDGFLDQITEEGNPPEHNEFSALSLGEDGLCWELHDMVKWWTRGKKELVKNHLKKIARKLEENDEF